ncbi:hypothetical protein RDWZM_002961 [Blomia tropicalis]|uniref:BTB domain-containing protein n=1 Tax=Blomia tropicalis TaxID=40697 RepID=A0A9Q0MED3_BLOTA|nr:hypothetical protein RDWZM_002961 [Blomia tropicalis]
MALSDKQLSDVILRTSDGIEFPSHKIILSIRSSVFKAMFNHQDFKENQENLVCFEDIDSNLMEHLLNYIYFGDISFDNQLASQLISQAHKYSIVSLTEICGQIMVNDIELESAAKLLYIADSYQLSSMKKEAMLFIKYNSGVKETDGWKEFIKPNVDLMEELVFFMSSIP